MGETYYEILEVDSDATQAEITAAYRERVLESHPDHNDAPDAATQFARVSRARAVLTDGDERARYDRLGHEAYERLGRYSRDSSETGDSGTRSGAKTTDSKKRTESANARGARGAADGTRARAGSARDAGTTSQATAGSHRARRRARRRRHSAREAAGGTSQPPPENETEESSVGGFRYTVHDWDGEITLEWEGHPIDRATMLTIDGCWLLYPLFVASSVTAIFPLAANAVLAVCTGVLVAYLLTRPRLATLLFGSWSLLFPFGLLQMPGASVISVPGLIALGAVWIPFGYALAFWWALRP